MTNLEGTAISLAICCMGRIFIESICGDLQKPLGESELR
jgi:hypothetical protein